MTTTLDKALTMLRAPTNRASFALRRALRWRRGAPRMHGESKDGLFDFLEPEAAAICESSARQLADRFDLSVLQEASGRVDYRDNLALLQALARLLDGSELHLPRSCRVVDVGAKNWNYAFALERFCRHWQCPSGRDVELTGIEIDGYGVYSDLRSRCDHAQAYAAQIGNTRVEYRVQDFLDCRAENLDLVTVFYPFLTRYALLQWGLPLACYKPQLMLEHALARLRPGGALVVFNQTSAECELLHRMLDELGVAVARCRPLATSLVHYHPRTEDRWGTLVLR